MPIKKQTRSDALNQPLAVDERDASSCFVDSLDHVLAELSRIDLLIQHQLNSIQDIFSSADNYRGLYISIEDLDNRLRKPIGEPWWFDKGREEGFRATSALNKSVADEIAQSRIRAQAQGIRLRLCDLADNFSLNPLELDILLLALAPEIDSRYELVYAYLQDDIGKKYLGIELALNLLGQSTRGKLDVRRHLAPRANLFKYRLLELSEYSAQTHDSFLSKSLRVPRRVVDYLLDIDSPDEGIDLAIKLQQTATQVAGLVLHPLTQNKVNKISQYLRRSANDSLIYLQGQEGAGKRDTAAAIAGARQHNLLCVDLERLCERNMAEFDELLRLVIREALLYKLDIYFSAFDLLKQDDKLNLKQSLICHLANFPGVVFASGHEDWVFKSEFSQKHIFHIELTPITPKQRESFWRDSLPGSYTALAKKELSFIADRFRFTPGQIRDAIATAQQLAQSEAPSHGEFGVDELYQACRLNTNRKLNTLAKRVVPKYSWEDITLEREKLLQLQQLHNTVQYRGLVFNDWGFDDKLSLGKGISALFTGPPGTGKTMAAEIIAKSLGLELYKIDLSLVVSKYIGETERNLARIFKEAETSNAILFFDEADALFGKRTDIKSSHDRYANVEVAYLLQKMDEYDGITIMATNLRKNMDEAFTRRLAFIIAFPFPEKADRKKIWQSIWPKNVPMAHDLDLDYMAGQFKLAGGNIKNIALAASFLAAEEGGAVAMKHLVLSTRREFEKQGRACVEADFGPYGIYLHHSEQEIAFKKNGELFTQHITG